ncbi:caspase family protein [Fulvivirga lutimaris]|uniref:caspase family protein n=1 Tax=Fulvivirga lutimaris TaxID=1819566 RepID=UPI0012BD1479|nr:caspase family protein [Fulvivirga lutimaris]MTI38698.1 caspase family protein [Fulvivirga lutimaris]
MYLRKILISMLTIASTVFCSAQQLSGVWSGELTAGRKTYNTKVIINEDGKALTGTVEVIGKKDSSKYYFNGYLEDNSVILASTAFIYKKGLHCLPKFKLALDSDKLEGTWGFNPVWGGCLPAVSGKISITQQSKVVVASSLNEAVVEVSYDDFEGTELVKALKERKYYALIVGINDYPDEGIPTLAQPINDAQKLIDALTTYYTFENENITFLKNPTRSNLIDAFDKLANTVKERDNLLIFYAGHGIWNDQLNQGFWLPSDASKASKSQWLSNGTIRDYIRAIKSKHTLLIADACFGGSILKERSVTMNGKAMLEMYKRPSRKAMTSGALSTVPDQSVFIKYLVKNLANNQAPLLSTEQVFSDFKFSVINNSETGQVPQYGAISLAGDEGGDFIFLKRD